jgi:hypothetical protein
MPRLLQNQARKGYNEQRSHCKIREMLRGRGDFSAVNQQFGIYQQIDGGRALRCE